VDTEKEELGCLKFFPHLSTHLGRTEKTFSSVLAKKRELPDITMTPEEFQKGR
jgi:hypothetical protein